jgi:hypothetical protein
MLLTPLTIFPAFPKATPAALPASPPIILPTRLPAILPPILVNEDVLKPEKAFYPDIKLEATLPPIADPAIPKTPARLSFPVAPPTAAPIEPPKEDPNPPAIYPENCPQSILLNHDGTEDEEPEAAPTGAI